MHSCSRMHITENRFWKLVLHNNNNNALQSMSCWLHAAAKKENGNELFATSICQKKKVFFLFSTEINVFAREEEKVEKCLRKEEKERKSIFALKYARFRKNGDFRKHSDQNLCLDFLTKLFPPFFAASCEKYILGRRRKKTLISFWQKSFFSQDGNKLASFFFFFSSPSCWKEAEKRFFFFRLFSSSALIISSVALALCTNSFLPSNAICIIHESFKCQARAKSNPTTRQSWRREEVFGHLFSPSASSFPVQTKFLKKFVFTCGE